MRMSKWTSCENCAWSKQLNKYICDDCRRSIDMNSNTLSEPTNFKPRKKYDMSKKDEERPSEMAKDYYHCSNCKNYGLESVCDMCVSQIDLKEGERIEHKPTMFEEKSSAYEYVDHPEHYQMTDKTYEPYKVINAWDLDFNLGSVLKYIARAGKKPGEDVIRDLNKCKEYIDFEIEKLSKMKEV